MSRNKNRYNKHRVRTARREVGGRVVPPGLLPAVLVAAAILCLGYLWINSRNEDIGRRIKNLETQKREIEQRVANEEYKWNRMMSPQSIQQLLQQHHINMALPEEKALARIRMTPTASYAAVHARQNHASVRSPVAEAEVND